ncbi:MAG: hypothetical protein KAJ19_05100 [Gammaproteobacteria bacterium]|nr:hypothetical protein [Gammaproteobacteria bacterium]
MPKKSAKKRKPGRPKGSTKHIDQIPRTLSFTQLDPVDRAMLAIVGTRPTIPNTQLAKLINLNLKAVTKRRGRGVFQVALEKIQMPAIEKCQEAQKEAAEVIIDLLKSDDEKIRLQAASVLLKPVIPNTSIVKHETGIDVTINNMSKEQLDAFIQKGIEGLDFEKVIEAKIIETDGD